MGRAPCEVGHERPDLRQLQSCGDRLRRAPPLRGDDRVEDPIPPRRASILTFLTSVSTVLTLVLLRVFYPFHPTGPGRPSAPPAHAARPHPPPCPSSSPPRSSRSCCLPPLRARLGFPARTALGTSLGRARPVQPINAGLVPPRKEAVSVMGSEHIVAGDDVLGRQISAEVDCVIASVEIVSLN